jgi:hypothetical protein
MFNNFSTTQLANYITFIMFLFTLFKVNVSKEEVETLVAGAIGLISIVVAFIQRYKRGDLFLLGGRK